MLNWTGDKIEAAVKEICAFANEFEHKGIGDFERDLRGEVGLNAQVDTFILLSFIRRRNIRLAKNNDYGGSWRAMGFKGLITRLSDKMQRIISLGWFGNSQKVSDESIRDTILDMNNYCDFAAFTLEEGNIDGSTLRL